MRKKCNVSSCSSFPYEISRIRDDASLIEFIGSGDVAFNYKLVHSYHVARYVNVLYKSHLKWGECYFSGKWWDWSSLFLTDK